MEFNRLIRKYIRLRLIVVLSLLGLLLLIPMLVHGQLPSSPVFATASHFLSEEQYVYSREISLEVNDLLATSSEGIVNSRSQVHDIVLVSHVDARAQWSFFLQLVSTLAGIMLIILLVITWSCSGWLHFGHR